MGRSKREGISANLAQVAAPCAFRLWSFPSDRPGLAKMNQPNDRRYSNDTGTANVTDGFVSKFWDLTHIRCATARNMGQIPDLISHPQNHTDRKPPHCATPHATRPADSALLKQEPYRLRAHRLPSSLEFVFTRSLDNGVGTPSARLGQRDRDSGVAKDDGARAVVCGDLGVQGQVKSLCGC